MILEKDIINAIKVVQLEKPDIDKLIETASKANSSMTDLSQVKIQLYEKKLDYSEAFMQYLNREGQHM